MLDAALAERITTNINDTGHIIGKGQRRVYRSFDFIMVALILALAVFGIIVLGSTMRIDINEIKPDSLFAKQILWIASGLVLMLVSAFVDYHFICKFYIPLYIVTIILLAAIFFTQEINGTARWFDVGTQSIQPSEFTKIFMIIFLAKFIDRMRERINKFPVFIGLILLALLPAALVYLQPSLSAAAVIAVISAAIIFGSKIKSRNILIFIVITAPIISFLYVDFFSDERVLIDKIMKGYQIERIEAMFDPTLDPDIYRQLENSEYAIGSGQLYGKGIYKGTHGQSTAESENDFIFAVVGEEFGFIGCSFLILLMFLIVCKCLYTAAKACDECGKLIALGGATMFFFQSFFHVGVTIGLMPVTGVTFPFFSYGGSSMWSCMIAAGLVINVGMTKNKLMFEA